ncbi:MAG: hypothetical protein U0K29_12275, partial [Prevotella sp.]|nr:hypothetical protein [Prevotella sp.]
NAFALTGRIVFGGFLPQGVALGYVLLPLRGVLLRLLTHPQQSMIQTLLFVMMICIRLADEVVSKVNYMG